MTFLNLIMPMNISINVLCSEMKVLSNDYFCGFIIILDTPRYSSDDRKVDYIHKVSDY